MNVECFVAGWLTADAGVWRDGDDRDERIRLPVPVYLVTTAERRILVDTGLHPAAVGDPAAYYRQPTLSGHFETELDQPISEQIDTNWITDIVITHLHFDHAAGLPLLPPSIPMIVQRTEWEAAHTRAGRLINGFRQLDYDQVERPVVLVDGDHDLIGDGSIRLLSTPGHTPGHQSVQIGEDLVIGADVAYFDAGFIDHRFPNFGSDRDEQVQSANRLQALRDSGVRVLPGHDPEVIFPWVIDLSGERSLA